jgi:hypothetical protein
MPRLTWCLATLVVVVAACGLLLAGGCGPRGKRLPETGATLEGTVSYGQERVMVAMIIVQGESGASTADVGEDGRYKVENVPLGTVYIGVNTAAGKGRMMGKFMAQSQNKGQGSLPKMIDVPDKYADPTASGITTTINKGENRFDIVIPK